MRYRLWKVIETTQAGFKELYYVVNTDKRVVQSVWVDMRDGINACNDLNAMIKRGVS